MLPIALVHLGNYPARWLVPNAVATEARFQTRVVIFTDNELIRQEALKNGIESVWLEDWVRRWPKSKFASISSQNFRNGFWVETTRRLFALKEVAKYFGGTPFLHIESDVVLLPSLRLSKFNLSEASIMFGMASSSLGSGAIIYIRNYAANDELLEFLTECFQDQRSENEMEALGQFQFQHLPSFLHLPVGLNQATSLFPKALSMAERTNYSSETTHFGGYFDVSTIGQYLTGTDGRNMKGLRVFYKDPVMSDFMPSALAYNTDSNGNLHGIELGENPTSFSQILSIHVHSKRLDIIGAVDPSPALRVCCERNERIVRKSLDMWAFSRWAIDGLRDRT